MPSLHMLMPRGRRLLFDGGPCGDQPCISCCDHCQPRLAVLPQRHCVAGPIAASCGAGVQVPTTAAAVRDRLRARDGQAVPENLLSTDICGDARRELGSATHMQRSVGVPLKGSWRWKPAVAACLGSSVSVTRGYTHPPPFKTAPAQMGPAPAMRDVASISAGATSATHAIELCQPGHRGLAPGGQVEIDIPVWPAMLQELAEDRVLSGCDVEDDAFVNITTRLQAGSLWAPEVREGELKPRPCNNAHRLRGDPPVASAPVCPHGKGACQ